MTVKVAAIEERCRFRKYLDTGESYIGIEIGADASSSLNLDEFMVFDNNGEQAKDFLAIYCTSMFFPWQMTCSESKTSFINDVFTQKAAFEEFVRASEGVPRDAINIAGLAAQHLGRQTNICSISQGSCSCDGTTVLRVKLFPVGRKLLSC